MLDRSSILSDMNKLTTAKRVQVVGALLEGMSINGTVRLTGVSKPTILKLLADLGAACSDYQDKHIVNLKTTHVQADELWSFIFGRKKNLAPERQNVFGFGDAWTFTAIDSHSKLIISFFVGNRDTQSATFFMRDVAMRLANRVQLTTDGLQAYIEAVDDAFDGDVDFARLVKVYATEHDGKYAPPVCIACERKVVSGNPDLTKISTSYVERNNLTIRMHNRRFGRLTNAHSKKLENHVHALSLHFMYYNFAKPNMALKGKTPAMASGLAAHVWSAEEIVGLLG
jgi:IS1 family transposase